MKKRCLIVLFLAFFSLHSQSEIIKLSATVHIDVSPGHDQLKKIAIDSLQILDETPESKVMKTQLKNTDVVIESGTRFSYPSTVYIDLSDKLRYRIETFTPCLKLSDTTFSNDNPIELIEKIIGISDKNRYYKKIVEQKKNKLLEEMLYDNSKNHKHFRIIDWMFFLYQLSEEIISKQNTQ